MREHTAVKVARCVLGRGGDGNISFLFDNMNSKSIVPHLSLVLLNLNVKSTKTVKTVVAPLQQMYSNESPKNAKKVKIHPVVKKATKVTHWNSPKDPDFIEVHRVSICEGCGASLDGVEPTAVERRQVSDIPPPKIQVTEHVGESVICPHCGRYHAAPFPAHVKSLLQYGPHIRALKRSKCSFSKNMCFMRMKPGCK